MADQTSRKLDYLSAVVSFGEDLLALTRRGEELALYQSASGFQAGGANAIVDADCVGGNMHLTAASTNAVVTIAGQLGGAVSAGMRNSLRLVSRQPKG